MNTLKLHIYNYIHKMFYSTLKSYIIHAQGIAQQAGTLHSSHQAGQMSSLTQAFRTKSLKCWGSCRWCCERPWCGPVACGGEAGVGGATTVSVSPLGHWQGPVGCKLVSVKHHRSSPSNQPTTSMAICSTGISTWYCCSGVWERWIIPLLAVQDPHCVFCFWQ